MGVQVLNYASVVVLAYWVDPEVHGFFAIASLAAGLAGVLGAMGLREIIIKDVDENFQDKVPSYWSLVLVAAGLLYVLSCALSLLIAWFYKDEFSFSEMLTTSLVLSIIAPLGPLRAMMEALHSRKFDFKRISVVNLISFFIGIVPVFILGYLDFDRLAIGGKFLLPHLSYILIGLLLYKLNFSLKWDKSILIKVKNFSTFYSLNNIANYFLRNIDYMVLAKFFPSSVLGQYVIAYKILLFPMKNVTSTIIRVGMPMLAKLDFEGEAFKRRYFSMLEGVSLLTFPVMIFLAVYSDSIVSLTFNDKYDLLPMMISTLAIVGAIQSVVSPVGMLFYFKENMRLMMATNIISFIIVALSILIFSYTGEIFNVLIAYAFSYVFLVMPVSILFIYPKYGFNLLNTIQAFGPYLISALLSVSVVYFTVHYFGEFLHDTWCLLVSLLLFSAFYLGCLLLIDRSKFGPKFYHEYLLKIKLIK